MSPAVGALEKSNSESTINVEIITIPTFTKLFPTRIVASRCWGLLSICKINFAVLFFLDLRLFRTAGDKEKNATSDPEINADEIRSTAITANPIMTGNVKGLTSISAKSKIEEILSVSKFYENEINVNK